MTMTDRERLLVALLGGDESPDPNGDGVVSVLAVAAMLDELGQRYRHGTDRVVAKRDRAPREFQPS